MAANSTMSQARRIAYEILQRIEPGNQTLDQVLDDHQTIIDRLERNDRALVHALIYGVLRWRARLDWTIDHFSAKPGKKMAAPIRTAIRLGLFQLLFMDRIPASAAVNTAVGLVKQGRHRWACGFVNALLRRAAAQKQPPLPTPAQNRDPAAYLSVVQSFPTWLARRWLDRFGLQQTEALCKTINSIPAITLRTNTLRTTRDQLIEGISNEVAAINPTPFSPEGVSIGSPRSAMHTWPAFKAGWFQVQDEAAQLIAHLLAPAAGQQVWDACAGLGTKTAHIAQLMHNRGRLLASDVQNRKLKQLTLEMRRMGLGPVQTAVMDLTQACMPPTHSGFDRILVDAPCSGLGVLQRNPDGKWRVQPADLKRHAARQSILLANAARFLKPGGRLVYSVCSFEPEETLDVVGTFLQKHPDFAMDANNLSSLHGGDQLLTSEGYLSTLPHRHATDGFFAAALVRSPKK